MEVTNSPDKTESNEFSFPDIIDIFYKPGYFFQKYINSLKFLWIIIGLVIISSAYYQYIILKAPLEEMLYYKEMTQSQFSQALLINWLYIAFLQLLTPLLYTMACSIGIWIFSKGRVWPKFQNILFIIMCGELLYSLGLILRVRMIYFTDDLNFSFSLGQILFSQIFERTATTYLLSFLDIFIIWEIIIITIGLVVYAKLNYFKAALLSIISIIGLPMFIFLTIIRS